MAEADKSELEQAPIEAPWESVKWPRRRAFWKRSSNSSVRRSPCGTPKCRRKAKREASSSVASFEAIKAEADEAKAAGAFVFLPSFLPSFLHSFIHSFIHSFFF